MTAISKKELFSTEVPCYVNREAEFQNDPEPLPDKMHKMCSKVQIMSLWKEQSDV